jgi:hypothetical protein
MRPLGSILMGAGVVVGAAVGIGILAGVNFPGSGLMAIGVVKLTLLAAVGLMGAGAALHRLARRDRARSLPRSGDGPPR